MPEISDVMRRKLMRSMTQAVSACFAMQHYAPEQYAQVSLNITLDGPDIIFGAGVPIWIRSKVKGMSMLGPFVLLPREEMLNVLKFNSYRQVGVLSPTEFTLLNETCPSSAFRSKTIYNVRSFVNRKGYLIDQHINAYAARGSLRLLAPALLPLEQNAKERHHA